MIRKLIHFQESSITTQNPRPLLNYHRMDLQLSKRYQSIFLIKFTSIIDVGVGNIVIIYVMFQGIPIVWQTWQRFSVKIMRTFVD